MTSSNPETDWREMLDTAYELEGLLQLAVNRDNAPARIADLISSKIERLRELLTDASADTPQPEPETPITENVPEEPDAPEIPEQPTGEESPETYEISEDCDTYDLDEEEPAVVVAPAVKSSPAPMSDNAVAESSASTPAVQQGGAAVAAIPVFSVNDRFLFARELFGGRMADFDEALKNVAGMESYEEAEEYFISERGFNPELPLVQDFLTIISNCFA
ncbi:MAG: hypothetical protein HDR98_02540 [Bacteroides sp.]|nr:hypothetical protein [Bacteroides sp.]